MGCTESEFHWVNRSNLCNVSSVALCKAQFSCECLQWNYLANLYNLYCYSSVHTADFTVLVQMPVQQETEKSQLLSNQMTEWRNPAIQLAFYMDFLTVSAGNYYHTVRNNPEVRRSRILRGGSLKSRQFIASIRNDTDSFMSIPEGIHKRLCLYDLND
jgi:hypothetical protein